MSNGIFSYKKILIKNLSDTYKYKNTLKKDFSLKLNSKLNAYTNEPLANSQKSS